ncbi:MAG TPA: aromatic amino acid hydroxylase [Bacteroidetes bacterium]|nr:aromatic amino acid hydroxylase [Bacteroidota bacterium]
MITSQDAVIASIPSYLRQFVVKQHYDEYTPQDHAVWRYVMNRNLDFLAKVAHPAYITGLQKTGINLEQIPHIDEMNDKLSKIGWKAVVVDGFVPPAAFMEFQAHKILVISAEIRNFKNILYTPAPDIIHEAAGHAPIIADEVYASYLQKIGEYGSKTVFSKLDYEIYEAIRELSIIKEYPDATPEEVKKAEDLLEQKIAENTNPSESALLARLHWWTVEYGLIGDVNDFQIYGAGILSSVGESKECMSPKVKKLPLSVDCCNYNYDITQMQPQLFVAKSFEHLHEVLEDFADGMCFRKGGLESAQKVIKSANVGTLELSSGLQISGVFTEVLGDAHGNPSFIKTSGLTGLAVSDKHLPGHGTDTHVEGFSAPIGLVKGHQKPLENWSDAELTDYGIQSGNNATIDFESGYQVIGKVENILRKNGNVVILGFSDCTAYDPAGVKVYRPEFGTFDMAIGASIVSAYSGSADKVNYNVYPPKSDKKAIKVTYSDSQKHVFSLYRQLEEFRKANETNPKDISKLYDTIRTSHPTDWLILVELLNFLKDRNQQSDLQDDIISDLRKLSEQNEEKRDLIEAGLHYLKINIEA